MQVKQIEQKRKSIKRTIDLSVQEAGDDPEKAARTTDRQIRFLAQTELVELTQEKLPLLRRRKYIEQQK